MTAAPLPRPRESRRRIGRTKARPRRKKYLDEQRADVTASPHARTSVSPRRAALALLTPSENTADQRRPGPAAAGERTHLVFVLFIRAHPPCFCFVYSCAPTLSEVDDDDDDGDGDGDGDGDVGVDGDGADDDSLIARECTLPEVECFAQAAARCVASSDTIGSARFAAGGAGNFRGDIPPPRNVVRNRPAVASAAVRGPPASRSLVLTVDERLPTAARSHGSPVGDSWTVRIGRSADYGNIRRPLQTTPPSRSNTHSVFSLQCPLRLFALIFRVFFLSPMQPDRQWQSREQQLVGPLGKQSVECLSPCAGCLYFPLLTQEEKDPVPHRCSAPLYSGLDSGGHTRALIRCAQAAAQVRIRRRCRSASAAATACSAAITDRYGSSWQMALWNLPCPSVCAPCSSPPSEFASPGNACAMGCVCCRPTRSPAVLGLLCLPLRTSRFPAPDLRSNLCSSHLQPPHCPPTADREIDSHVCARMRAGSRSFAPLESPRRPPSRPTPWQSPPRRRPRRSRRCGPSPPSRCSRS